MFRPTILALALAVAADPAALAERPGAPAPNAVAWNYSASANPEGKEQLRFERHGMNDSLDAAEAPEVFAELAGATRAAGQAVSFALQREAGSLACNGQYSGSGEAQGWCQFAPDKAFAAALAARHLTPEDRDDYLALTLVDARIALVDGLLQLGVQLDDSQHLIAMSALHVTPDYARELKGAGLQIDDPEKLIAARAVDVDGAWLAEMAAAGYPRLSLDQAIAMRATGVTPDYARRMARALAATGSK